MKKLLFPFATEKYKFLENKRWHKLIKVMFILWAISLFIYIKMNLEDSNLLVTSVIFIMIGISYYIVQQLYLKIIIYIIYGKKK